VHSSLEVTQYLVKAKLWLVFRLEMGASVGPPLAPWPLHDIGIANIVWYILQLRVVGGKHYVPQ